MISAGRFDDFIREILNIYNEEQEDKTLWEMWLHKVHDKSYNAFKESLGMIGNKKAAPTKEETAEVIQESKTLLNGFRIAEVGKDGTIQAAGNNSD
jgi:hypothetical protein